VIFFHASLTFFSALSAPSWFYRPPLGHGKSVLLKSLAGRMVREGSAVQGEVRWNGLTAAESAHAGQQLNKLTAYVDQGDVHFPMLTVRETFQFALDSSNADVTLLPGTDAAELKKQQDNKVELMLELLGLKESEHTKVGNAMTRGVSGGSDVHFIHIIAAHTAHALVVGRTVADDWLFVCCCCSFSF
jgi:ABC-type glutathione transport system ATPase component